MGGIISICQQLRIQQESSWMVQAGSKASKDTLNYPALGDESGDTIGQESGKGRGAERHLRRCI